MNLDTLTKRIRALVDDSDATYTTDAFLLPLINQSYEELFQRIKLAGSEFDEQVIELPSVPIGTENLNAYQDAGQPLEFLIEPSMVEWKLAGADPITYLRADGPLNKVRDVIAGQILDSWEFRGQQIFITPFTVPLDLRITGSFMLSALSDENQQIMVGVQIGHALAYSVASLVGTVRGNIPWEKRYQEKCDSAVDDLTQLLTRAQQRKIRRVARMSRNWKRWNSSNNVFIGSAPTTNSGGGDSTLTIIQVFIDQNITNIYQNLLVQAYGGSVGITLTLPQASTAQKQQITFKKMDLDSDGPVTVQGYSGEIIDTAAQYILTNQYQFVSVISDGVKWNIVSND